MTEVSALIPNGAQAASALRQTAELASYAEPSLLAAFSLDCQEDDGGMFGANIDTYAPMPGRNLSSITTMISALTLVRPTVDLRVNMAETDMHYVCAKVDLEDQKPPLANVEFFTLPYPAQSTPLTREHIAAVSTFADLLQSMGSATVAYVGVNMAEQPPTIMADIEDPDGTALAVLKSGIAEPEESEPLSVQGVAERTVSGMLEMFAVSTTFFQETPARY